MAEQLPLFRWSTARPRRRRTRVYLARIRAWWRVCTGGPAYWTDLEIVTPLRRRFVQLRLPS